MIYIYILQPDFAMETVDKDFKKEFVAAFQYAVKVMPYYLHVSFLETCRSCTLYPTGLNIRKKPFIEFESEDLIIFWKETLLSTENDLLDALFVEICERMFTLEKIFRTNCRNSIKITQKKIRETG